MPETTHATKMRATAYVLVWLTVAAPIATALPLLNEGPYGAWRIEPLTPLSDWAIQPAIASTSTGEPVITGGITAPNGTWTTPGVLWKENDLWMRQVFPRQGGGRGVALDSTGTIHLLTIDTSYNMYYHRSDNGWIEEPIAFGWGKLLLTPDGVPHVYADTGGVTKWYTRVSPGSWTAETVGPIGSSIKMQATMAPDGTPYIYELSDKRIRHRDASGVWSDLAVPSTCSGISGGIAVDATGVIHIACYAFSSPARYLKYDGAWHDTVLPGRAEDSPTVRIASTPEGIVTIATAFDGPTGINLGVTTRTPAGWVREIVDPIGRVANTESLDLTLTPAGQPQIVYKTFSGVPAHALGEIRYATPATNPT